MDDLKPPKIPLKQVLFFFLLLIFIFSYIPRQNDYLKIHGETMGTTYTIVAKTTDSKKLGDKIETVLWTVNQSMSTYIKDSEISRFNRNQSLKPIPVSTPLYQLVQKSMKLSKLSSGAFDITIMPLVEAYGFGPQRKRKPPTRDELESLRSQIGFSKLKLLDGNRLQKTHPDLSIDLSAIAKGYGVDELALLLDSEGIHDYLVEIGGEIRVKGSPGKERVWKLGISYPGENSKPEDIFRVISLNEGAMATSGNYRNYWKDEETRLVHIIDPVHFISRPTDVLSVSVVAQDCAWADALATASMVLGSRKAIELLNSLDGVEYLLILEAQKGQLKTLFSKNIKVQDLETPEQK